MFNCLEERDRGTLGFVKPARIMGSADPEEDLLMATGTVKWFNHAKGYGFIKPEDGDDLFVHISNVDDADKHRITDNDPVEFDVRPGRKGEEAYNVRVTR